MQKGVTVRDGNFNTQVPLLNSSLNTQAAVSTMPNNELSQVNELSGMDVEFAQLKQFIDDKPP